MSPVMLATVLTACAGPRASEPRGQGAPPTTAPSRPLVILTRGEPIALAVRAFQNVGGGSYPHLVLNATFDDVPAGLRLRGHGASG